MARAIWTGSISFGLVNIPVGLYSAVFEKTIRFHQLERGTSDRVSNRRVNERTGKEVEYSEIVKGYDVGEGQYVVLSPAELESVEPTGSRTIEMDDFVDPDEIDPIFYDQTYYVTPKTAAAGRPYALIAEAVREAGKLAVATFVMRSKEHLAALRVHGEVLALETMYFADEIRDPPQEIEVLPSGESPTRRELETAISLIESLSASWEPTKYHDRFRARVEQLIEAKRAGQQVVASRPKEADSNVVDLMEALQRSVERVRRTRTAELGEPARASAPEQTAAGANTSKSTPPGAASERTRSRRRWCMSPGEKTTVEIEGRELQLSNLDKVLFPDGFTKGQLIDYYVQVAPFLLPHLKDRPVTVKRFPEGVGRSGFIEKNLPPHAPEWISTVGLPRKGAGRGQRGESSRDTTEYALVNDLATLVWLANLAAVELHTPMWRIGPDHKPRSPDLLVFDLDPGKPAAMRECCQVAILLRRELEGEGIGLLAKTSGSKGLQCYGRIAGRRWPPGRSNAYAHELAERTERGNQALVVSRMARALRPGKVLIDWSQNNAAKTTVSVYSLRAVASPAVSTPVRWDEVEACACAEVQSLSFPPAEVLDRLERAGDLFSPLL